MTELFEKAAVAVEVVAVFLLLAGLTLSTGRFVYRVVQKRGQPAVQAYRQELGRSLQLALEFLIVADIIDTIAVEQTFASLGQLGMLVFIRTFLSFAMELELTGRWPWQGHGDASDSSPIHG